LFDVGFEMRVLALTFVISLGTVADAATLKLVDARGRATCEYSQYRFNGDEASGRSDSYTGSLADPDFSTTAEVAVGPCTSGFTSIDMLAGNGKYTTSANTDDEYGGNSVISSGASASYLIEYMFEYDGPTRVLRSGSFSWTYSVDGEYEPNGGFEGDASFTISTHETTVSHSSIAFGAFRDPQDPSGYALLNTFYGAAINNLDTFANDAAFYWDAYLTHDDFVLEPGMFIQMSFATLGGVGSTTPNTGGGGFATLDSSHTALFAANLPDDITLDLGLWANETVSWVNRQPTDPEEPPVSTVPLPAGAPLMVAGLVSLVWVRSRRRPA
jgi:hypothetical protein